MTDDTAALIERANAWQKMPTTSITDVTDASFIIDDLIAALERERADAARLRAENERLKRPDFWWEESNPEHPWESATEYLVDEPEGQIIHFRTGNDTGKWFAAWLRADPDSGSDDEWMVDGPDMAEVARALQDEKERRAALEPRHD